MAEDTNNLLYGPVANLEALLAASRTFQGLIGAQYLSDSANEAEAARHIYYPAIAAADVAAARPFAIIMGPAAARGSRAGIGAAYAHSGQIVFAIEADVPAEYAGETTAAYAAAETWFLALVGDILAEMLTKAAGGSYLDMTGWEMPEPIQRTDAADAAVQGDYYRAILAINWGSE